MVKVKLLLENWRTYEQEMLWEQEYEQLFNKHFVINEIEEGLMDDVLRLGTTVKDTILNLIDDIKTWTDEQIQGFVKMMGKKLEQFILFLEKNGALKKYEARNELNAIKLLMTNKHIDLAVMIFTAIAKLTSGFAALDKVVKTPEILDKVMGLLNSPAAELKGLLGDVSDVVQMIKKFIEFRKDKGTTAANFGQWADFGGLAEQWNNETPT